MPPEQDPFSIEHGLPAETGTVDRTPPGAAFCHIAGRSFISVTGADALTFLQGQLTGDLRLLGNGDRCQLTAYCTLKGRVIAQFAAFPIEGGYLLQLSAELADPVARRLQMFVMRSQVKVARVDDQWNAFGIWGEETAAHVAPAGAALPPAAFDCRVAGDRVLARMPGAPPRFQLIAQAELTAGLLEALTASAVSLPPAAWRLAEIRDGLPTVCTVTSETFLPQMLNLDLLGGIAFDKGCFVGQEVIARIKYLGKVKRRMYRALTDADAAAGDRIESPQSKSAQGAGTVVDACRNEQGRVELLVVLEHTAAAGTVTLGSTDGATLEVAQPPYPILDE